jgi:hypothetical protein
LLFDVATIDDALRNEQCRSVFCIFCPVGRCALMPGAIYDETLTMVFIGATQKIGRSPRRSGGGRFGIKIVEENLEHTFHDVGTAQSDVRIYSGG